MAIKRVEKIDDLVAVKNILVSVSDKRNLDRFVSTLASLDRPVRFYSTGGTFTALSDMLGSNSDRLIQVADYTGQPEVSGGLVKTLDFRIHLGILGETYNQSHRSDMARLRAVAFDLVVVNLYPFTAVVSKDSADLEDARGHIDIGGPCMLRGAAKNFLRVGAVCDPDDYDFVADEILRAGGLRFATRYRLASKAFEHTASYDRAIADYFRSPVADPATIYQVANGEESFGE
jgi:phosphoribosylaminoimidazolecarboxamide formyltransferase / IMP cyclohydrolase